MSYTWEEAEAWAKRKQSIDNWRQEVAYSSQPIVIPTRDASFRKGVPAPVEVSVDDGMSFRSGPRSMSIRDHHSRGEPRIIRRRQLVRRPSSDHGGYSRAREAEARSPSQPIVERAAPRRRSLSHHHRVEVVREEPSPPKRTSRAPTKPPPAFLNPLLPSTTRGGRSRAVAYEKPPSYEKMTYDRPRHRDVSPRYRTAREPDPEDIRHKTRSRSVYASQQPVVVTRNARRRSGSVDMNERMRLLAIRDRFREEVDRARGDWASARPKSQRYQEYERRSLR